jgi:hypothetical protein
MSGSLRSYFFHEFAWLLICTTTAFCQTVPSTTLRGTVLDDSTGSPLPLANVFISNSTIGAASDTWGSFILKGVPLGNQEIIASIVGYATQIKTLRLTDTTVYEVGFRLKPRPVQMLGLEIVGRQPTEWKRNLQEFLKLFFGSTPNATHCALLNPEVLDFIVDDETGSFSASARQPLDIENKALGYRIQLFLDSLEERNFVHRSAPSTFQCVGHARFTPLLPQDKDEENRWRENRKETYYGSLRHFFSSLVRGKCKEEGFKVYIASSSYVRIKVDPDTLLSSDRHGFERRLPFNGVLQIVYEGARETQVTQINLSQPFAIVYPDGLLADPMSITTRGYWATQRVADVLPLDYKPGEQSSSNDDTNSTARAITPTYIVPLAVGNQWTTRTSSRNAEGKLISSGIQTSRIISDTTVDGERWFVEEFSSSDNNSSRTRLCTNRSDGFYILRSGAPLLSVKYPVNVGDRYQGFGGDAKVVSTNEKISVPKGTFVCYQYTVSLRGPAMGRATMYYFPGVGLVSTEAVTFGANNVSTAYTYTVELLDYILH